MYVLTKRVFLNIAIVCLLSAALTAQSPQQTQAQTVFQQGLTAFNAGRYDEARELFKQLPAEPAAQYNVGLTYMRQKRYGEAIPALQEAIRLRPDYVAALIELGNTYDYLEKLDDAVAAYKKAIAIQPTNGGVYYELGVAYYSHQKYAEALESLQQSIKLKPDAPNTYAKLGQTYNALKRFDDALLALKEAARLKADFALAYKEMGDAYNGKQAFSQAIVAFQEAIRITPTYADAYLGLGNSYYNNKQYADAIAPYQNAAKNSPKWITAHEYLADTLFNVKRYSEAKSEYQEVLQLNPKHVHSLFLLGKTLALLNDMKGAWEQKDRLAAVDNAKAEELKTYLNSFGATATVATNQTAANSYPTLAKLETYIAPPNPSPIPETYSFRLQKQMPVPPSKMDTFICDLWILMNQDLKLTGIKENIVSTLDVNQVLNFYLTTDAMKIRGYRSWAHQNFVKSLTADQRKALSQEVVKYMAANGVREASDAKKTTVSLK